MYNLLIYFGFKQPSFKNKNSYYYLCFKLEIIQPKTKNLKTPHYYLILHLFC